MGGIGVLLAAAAAAGQVPLVRHSAWDPPVHQQYLDGAYGGGTLEQRPVEQADYYDAALGKWYTYVAGTMTGAAGGKVYAVYRYYTDNPRSTQPNELKIWAYYPINHLTTTDTFRCTGMAIDMLDGDVFLTGWTDRGGDRDYLTVKFDKNLIRDTEWGDFGERFFDGGGDDEAVDVLVYSAGEDQRVVVTGDSAGTLTDIVTVAYYGEDCETCSPPREAGDTAWESRYNDPGNGHDTATELAATRIASQGPPGEVPGVVPVVGGTVYNTAALGLDIGVLRYKADGIIAWVRMFGRAGEDRCTGVGTYDGELSQGTPYPIVVCGSTPHYPPNPDDTNYVTIALDTPYGNNYWPAPAWREWVNPKGLGTSDEPLGVTLAGDNPMIAWVTGKVGVDDKHDVGTIAYYLTGPSWGQVYGSNLFDADADDSGASIRVQGPCVYTTGTTGGDGLSRILTVKYSLDPLTVAATGLSSGGYQEGIALWRGIDTGPLGCGRSISQSAGFEWVIFRYLP